MPDWEGDIVGIIAGSPFNYTSQIPNVQYAQEIEIGNTVTGIGDYAFFNCENLITVTIPDSVKTIESDSFIGCINTTDVYCYPNPANLTWQEDGDDFHVDKETLCHVKSEYLTAYETKNRGVCVTFIGDLT